MPTIWVKHLGSLRPGDEEAEAVLRSIGQGELVSVEVKRPRNIRFHNKFFAMLKIILDNQELYKSKTQLLDVCKIAIGHVEVIERKGIQYMKPKSISWAAMDETAFQDFYDRAVAWVAEEVVPGLRRQDLDEEVEIALLGFGEGP